MGDLGYRPSRRGVSALKPYVVWSGENLCLAGDCREYLRGVGLYYLTHPAFEQAFRRVLDEYRPPKRFRLGLVLPCSYGKPYSQSYIHYLIIRAIKESGFYDDVHQIIVTNAGVVPRELEEYYPFSAYDWNPAYETPEVKEEYVRVLADRLAAYLSRFSDYYERLAAYLRHDSDSIRAVAEASRRLGLEIPNLAPRSVPREEVEDVTMGLRQYASDPDAVLATPTALRSLREGIRRLLGEGGGSRP